jgi:hypothetical protein
MNSVNRILFCNSFALAKVPKFMLRESCSAAVAKAWLLQKIASPPKLAAKTDLLRGELKKT